MIDPVSSVGIDVLEIGRLERALARRPRLGERLFTDAERAYAAQRARPAQHLAARFCAKEAVAKALRLQAWRWLEVGGDGAVSLHGAVARRAGEARVNVSLTHSRELAGAVALVE